MWLFRKASSESPLNLNLDADSATSSSYPTLQMPPHSSPSRHAGNGNGQFLHTRNPPGTRQEHLPPSPSKSAFRGPTSCFPVPSAASGPSCLPSLQQITDILQAQVREEILHHLTHAIQELVTQSTRVREDRRNKGTTTKLTTIHEDSSSSFKGGAKGSNGSSKDVRVKLDGESQGVQDLCLAVEQACFHGIKTKEFHGQLPFWDLVEGLAGTANQSSRSLQKESVLCDLVARVRKNVDLHTAVGRARSFLRHALHDGLLMNVMECVVGHPAQLRTFYSPEALVLHPDDCSLLMQVLGSIEEHFRLNIKDADAPTLDREPQWPLINVKTQVIKGGDRNVLAATLIEDLTTWSLDDQMETTTLEKFQRTDSFNSSVRRMGAKDSVLDILLDNSGVQLKHMEVGSRSSTPATPPRPKSRSRSPFQDQQDKGLAAASPLTNRSSPLSSGSSNGLPAGRKLRRQGSNNSNGSSDNEVGPVYVTAAHFLLSPGRPKTKMGAKLFGEPLVHLVRDVETCRFALLEPSLGTPYIFEEMIDFLADHLDTHRLFETKVVTWRVSGLSKILDEYQEMPPDADPHVCAATLILGLRMLPDPLLTFERYHSFLSAARIIDPEVRREAIKARIHDLPIEHKPTLRRLMYLFWRACHEDGDIMVDSRVLAPIVCRSVLRSYVPENKTDPPEAVSLVQAMIDEYPYYFCELREEEARKAIALQNKVQRLSMVVDETKVPARESDPDCLELYKELFRFLTRVEERHIKAITVQVEPTPSFVLTDDFGCVVPAGLKGDDSTGSNQGSSSSSCPRSGLVTAAATTISTPAAAVAAAAATSSSSSASSAPAAGAAAEDKVPFALDSDRWATCGFIPDDPGCEFGPSGKLTLSCMVYFIKRFPNVAAEMIFQYSKTGRRGGYISFPALCGHVVRLVLGLLKMLPPTNKNVPLSVSSFAQAPYWKLLDDENAIREVFCVAITLLDFLHYHEAILVEVLEAHLLETKRQLSWALSQGPLEVKALWELWLAIRAELRRRFKKAHDKEAATLAAASHSEGLVGAQGEVSQEAEQESAEEQTQDLACLLETDPTNENIVYKNSKGVRSKMIGRSSILKPWHVITLERALPETHQDYDWKMLYNLKKHGSAMYSIFERCKGHPYTLLVVQDSAGTVFGGFATDQWKDKKHAYYGSGECYLYSFKDDRFVKFIWTRLNSYFMLSNFDGLAMGGGGHFGLYLDGELNRGSSDECSTFGSTTLSGEKTFDIVSIEIWGFQTPLTSIASMSPPRYRSGGGGLAQSLSRELEEDGYNRGGGYDETDHSF